MLIKVYNLKTTTIETIEDSEIIKGVHVNRNTHEDFPEVKKEVVSDKRNKAK